MSSTQTSHRNAHSGDRRRRTSERQAAARPHLPRACEQALARPWVQWAAVVFGLLGAVAVAAAALVVGPLPSDHPQEWWFDLPLDSVPVRERIDALNKVFYAGLAAMTGGWLVVGVGVRAGRWRVRWLWGLGALWATPWLIAPVAMSTDIYTYLAQALVADSGLNPYTTGPAAAELPAAVRDRMSPAWLHTPTPYGPTFIGLAKLIAPLAAEHIVRAVVLLRLVAAAGIALAAICLPRVARHAGGDPAVATWLGLVSPLMLVSGVLSGHNDALMVGLVVAALAVATAGWRLAPVVAIGVAAVATLVKAPAAAAVVVLTLGWMRRAPNARAGAARLAGSILAVAVAAAVVSFASGAGTSWMGMAGFSSPLKSSPPFTPTTAVSITIDAVANLLGVESSQPEILRFVRFVGQGLAVAFAGLVLWRQPRLGDARTIGLVFAAAVLASPTVWPWYLVWPALLLAAAPGGRSRPAWVVLVATGVFLVRSDGGPGLWEPPAVHLLTAGVLAALVGASVFAWRALIKGERLPPGTPPATLQRWAPVRGDQ